MINISNIPNQPGVYMFLSKSGKILYVGKAKNLKLRVSSYFNNTKKAIKTERMLSNAYDIKFIVTKNEVEAFLLESNIIKTEKPKYNILLKDSKSYPYIKLTDEKYPRILVTRNTTDSNAKYFGPFVNVSNLRDLLLSLQKIFPLRSCNNTKFNEKKLCMNYQIKKCLGPCESKISREDYLKNVEQLNDFFSGDTQKVKKFFENKMKSEAENLNFEEASIYRDRLKSLDFLFSNQNVTLTGFNKFLDGFVFHNYNNIFAVTVVIIRNGKLIGTKTEILKDDISKESMESYILQFYNSIRQYPEEIFIQEPLDILDRDLVKKALEKISNKKIIIRQKGIKGLIEHANNNGKLQIELYLQKTEHYFYALNKLKHIFSMNELPKTLECIDISHLSGNFTVGVSIKWSENDFYKKGYKKYKMKLDFNDDFKSIYELFIRKLKRIKADEEELADVYVIDGGIGQLNAAKKAFDEMGINTHLMSISKGRSIKDEKFDSDKSIESLHIYGRSNPLNLKRNDKLLLFIQKLRDEAHRFVIDYSRKLALKDLTKSPLLEIEGIGEKRLRNILINFPDIHDNHNISAEMIVKECKLPKNIAEKIIKFVNSD
jgi:excinuclease ABC subunit C